MYLFLQQLRIQFLRNLTLFVSDKINLFLAFAQAPLIASLMVITFFGNSLDCHKKDLMARTFDHYAASTSGLKTIDIEQLSNFVEESYNKALNETTEDSLIFSEAMAQNRSVIYFVLVAAAIWMGILGSCKEIVSEWEVIHRESHSRISTLAYITSKSILLCFIAGIQTFFLTFLSLPFLIPGVPVFHTLNVWLILWLTAACAVETGLLVSCLSSSLQMALTCVPILMIPQLLLGGFLRPPARSTEYPLRDLAAAMTIQRWAFEACIAIETRGKSDILKRVDTGFKPKQKIIEIFLERDNNSATGSHNSKLERVWRVIGCRYHALDNYFFTGPEDPAAAWVLHYQRPVKVLLYSLLGLFCALSCLLKLRILLTNAGGRGIFFIIRASIKK